MAAGIIQLNLLYRFIAAVEQLPETTTETLLVGNGYWLKRADLKYLTPSKEVTADGQRTYYFKLWPTGQGRCWVRVPGTHYFTSIDYEMGKYEKHKMAWMAIKLQEAHETMIQEWNTVGIHLAQGA